MAATRRALFLFLPFSPQQERLFNRLESTDFEDRIYEFNDEMYDEAEEDVLKKIKTYDAEHPRA